MDQSDLETNSENQDMYLSIVTNNKLEFFAKACRWVKTEEVQKNVQVLNNGKYQNYSYKIPARREKIIQEVNVKLESNLPSWFTKRLGEIKTTPAFKGNWRNPGQYSFDDSFENFPALSKSVPHPIMTDVGYTFKDEIITVFSLPKDCEPSEYLKTNKVDVGAMISNLMEYTNKEEDGFWDALGEWLIDNELVDSKFGQQMKTYLTYVTN